MPVNGRQATQRRAGVVPTRRVRLARGYSRFVAVMRWLLPLSAAGLAAALIAWPYLEKRDDGFHMIMSDLEIDDPDRIAMTNARFLGTDEKGQPYTLTTSEAWQDPKNKDLIHLDTVEGDILLKSGAWVALNATSGTYNQPDQVLTLRDDVSIYTDEGYELHTNVASFDLTTGKGWGDEPVSGQGPAGLLDAQGFRISQDDGRLEFVGPVHMTLYPGTKP